MPSRKMSKYIRKCRTDRYLKNIDEEIKKGSFDKFKYVNISKKTFIEFCRICANIPMEIDLTKKAVGSYGGLLDLYESLEQLVEKNPQMAADPQLDAIAYLFDNRLFDIKI